MIVVRHIFVDEPVQVPVIDDQHVIQTLASHVADEPLANRVGFGRSDRRPDNLDPSSLCSLSETSSVLAIVVPDQKARPLSHQEITPDGLFDPHRAG
jgi:hypothetical protein